MKDDPIIMGTVKSLPGQSKGTERETEEVGSNNRNESKLIQERRRRGETYQGSDAGKDEDGDVLSCSAVCVRESDQCVCHEGHDVMK